MLGSLNKGLGFNTLFFVCHEAIAQTNKTRKYLQQDVTQVFKPLCHSQVLQWALIYTT